LRDVVLERLARQWQGLGHEQWLERIVLHYLDGKVHVDVFVRRGDLGQDAQAELSAAIRTRAAQAEDVGEVQVYFSD